MAQVQITEHRGMNPFWEAVTPKANDSTLPWCFSAVHGIQMNSRRTTQPAREKPNMGTITKPLSLESESCGPEQSTKQKAGELGEGCAQRSEILSALPRFTSTSSCWDWQIVRVYVGREKLHPET